MPTWRLWAACCNFNVPYWYLRQFFITVLLTHIGAEEFFLACWHLIGLCYCFLVLYWLLGLLCSVAPYRHLRGPFTTYLLRHTGSWESSLPRMCYIILTAKRVLLGSSVVSYWRLKVEKSVLQSCCALFTAKRVLWFSPFVPCWQLKELFATVLLCPVDRWTSSLLQSCGAILIGERVLCYSPVVPYW